MSYAELDRFADRLAAALAARQLQAGDRVATHLDNSIEAIALIHAVARVGAVLVPLNTRLTPTERARQLSLVEPKLLVVDDEFVSADGDYKPQETVTLAHLSHQEPQFGPEFRASCPDQSRLPQAQSVIFTSGTTGAPKGVQLSFDNHFWSATASAYHLGVEYERPLAQLPPSLSRWRPGRRLSFLPLRHRHRPPTQLRPGAVPAQPAPGSSNPYLARADDAPQASAQFPPNRMAAIPANGPAGGRRRNRRSPDRR